MNVLILGCNEHQIPYITELKKLDYTVIGTDINGNAAGIDQCHHFYNYGYTDIENLIKVCDEHLPVKVFTASCQHACLTVAILSEHLGIDYMPKESIEICLDKVKYYKYFKEHGVPIPDTTTIFNQEHLDQTLNRSPVQTWYLKSDYSKNPNYIYRFNSVDDITINWKQDQYFRQFYTLQPEFIGEHYRINIFYDQWNAYNFDVNDKSIPPKELLEELGVIPTLKYLTSSLGLTKYIVKYDVIVTEDSYVVLDIGLDRPYRMLLDIGEPFYKQYIYHYIHGVINYGS